MDGILKEISMNTNRFILILITCSGRVHVEMIWYYLKKASLALKIVWNRCYENDIYGETGITQTSLMESYSMNTFIYMKAKNI